ncbi:MAG: hypothetical protein ACE5HH_04725, partial [Candidatus Hydrothermarchaeales archaeon]
EKNLTLKEAEVVEHCFREDMKRYNYTFKFDKKATMWVLFDWVSDLSYIKDFIFEFVKLVRNKFYYRLKLFYFIIKK